MPQKENNFTGFVAYYNNRKVKEKENYFSKEHNQKKATNWSEINKNKLTALELLWHGKSKIKISKEEYPKIKPKDWFFSHSAIYDMESQKIRTVARNIGFKKDKIINIFTVEEKSGNLKTSVRR